MKIQGSEDRENVSLLSLSLQHEHSFYTTTYDFSCRFSLWKSWSFRGYAVRKTGAGSLNFNSGFNFDQELNFPTAKFLLIHLTPKFCLMDCFMILTDLVCEVISENEECGKLLGFIHS